MTCRRYGSHPPYSTPLRMHKYVKFLIIAAVISYFFIIINLNISFDAHQNAVSFDTQARSESSEYANAQVRSENSEYKNDIGLLHLSSALSSVLSSPPKDLKKISYVIIGAQKSGTTILHRVLKEAIEELGETKMFLPFKEYHIFDRDLLNVTADLLEDAVLNIHTKFLSFAEPDSVVIVRNPMLLFELDWALPLLRKLSKPDVKFIVLMKDPRKRAVSHYRHNLQISRKKKTKPYWASITQAIEEDLNILYRLGFNNTNQEAQISLLFETQSQQQNPLLMEFNNAVVRNNRIGSDNEMIAWSHYQKIAMDTFPNRMGEQAIIGRGLYDVQLRSWFKYFSKESFFFINTEDLESDSFLEKRKRDIFDGDNFNKKKKKSMSKISQELFDFLGMPHRHFSLNIPRRRSSHYYLKSKQTDFLVGVPESLSNSLRDFYSPHNKQLGDLLGPEWKNVWGR
mmetsp:Transcript_4944/g.7245  ORF Transcript_4944/g.7245 Transcript_4944/m.7245 type:complete len:455 (-) Transcript_4944:52-1416(-)